MRRASFWAQLCGSHVWCALTMCARSIPRWLPLPPKVAGRNERVGGLAGSLGATCRRALNAARLDQAQWGPDQSYVYLIGVFSFHKRPRR